MTALPPVANTAKIQLHHTYGTDANVVNSFHCVFSGTSTETTMNAWAAWIGNHWGTDVASILSAQITLNSVLVQDLTSSSGAVGQATVNTAGTGAAGAPANVAMVVRYIIARRYRGGRPHVSLAGLPATDLIDEDHWAPAVVTSAQTAWSTFMGHVASYTGGGLTSSEIVNVSYYQNHTWQQDQHGNWHKLLTLRPSPVIDQVTGYTVRPTIGSQRKRAQP